MLRGARIALLGIFLSLITTAAQTTELSSTERQFANGLALINAGQPRPAAALFEAILAQNPDLVRVRLELARAYFLSRQWGRSRSEFLAVLSGDIPEPVRLNVLRFLREIDARRGFEWDANVAFVTLGDTRNYETDTIQIDVGGNSLPFKLNGRDGETSQGLRFAVSGGYRQIIPAWSAQTARTLGFGRFLVAGDEAPGSRFDDLTLAVEGGVRLIWPQSALTITPRVSRRFLAGERSEDKAGLSTTFQHRSERGTVYSLSGSWFDIGHHSVDARDGDIVSVSLSASHPLSPRTLIGARLLVEDRDATSSVEDYRRTRVTAFGHFDMGRGITLSPSLYVEDRTAQATGALAADHLGTGAALTVENSQIIVGAGFTPYVSLFASRIRSDLAALSYTETGVSLGWEKRF